MEAGHRRFEAEEKDFSCHRHPAHKSWSATQDREPASVAISTLQVGPAEGFDSPPRRGSQGAALRTRRIQPVGSRETPTTPARDPQARIALHASEGYARGHVRGSGRPMV